ncbi:glutamate receptor ionotropic, kainate 2-like [Diabrotica undecimpunctata]|uniref:glutamate receptor ionotropic, kainate 2-like n=1 Tax=Diabrotica undecimpunctata TaxID=50387 RepID=UPI003B633A6F
MAKTVVWSVFLITSCSLFNYVTCAKTVVTIGVLLQDLTSQITIPLNSTIYKKNMFDQRAYFSTKIMKVSGTDDFEASQTLCNMLESDMGVIAIYSDAVKSVPILESTCTNFEIPFISTSWKNPSASKKDTETEARALLNFFPEAELYSKGLAEIVRSLQWKSFIIIYETEEGLIRMQEILKLQELSPDSRKNNILVMQLGPGPDYRPVLKKIRNTTEDNIILDCQNENILAVLTQAKSVGMLTLHNRYFLTSLDAHTIDFSVLNTTANITTIRLHDPKSDDFLNTIHRWELTEFENHNKRIPLDPLSIKTETVLFHDAILLLTDTINALTIKPGISNKPLLCNGTDISEHGFILRKYTQINKPSLTLTGPIKFNDEGERIDFNIQVIDIIDDSIIATWFASNETLSLGRDYNQTIDAAILNLQKITVIVSSRIGEPYLRYRNVSYEGEVLTGNNRYEGYSMDLIAGIAKIIGFNFQFELTEKYGNWDAAEKRWNGLVGEIIEKRAHLAICDLTITPERREVVDFSMPFMTLGISIMHKAPTKEDVSIFGFLDPFSPIVWIYTATLYLVISIVLFFISRMTPGDWENPHPCEDNPEELENIWDIRNCLWLTLGSIMTQGCDILPKGISSRMAVGMWWFFSLIMTSSYTANLAAFLTKANLEPPIDGAEALAKQTKIKYGCLAGGATESFFKNSNFTTYQRMWLNMIQAKPSVFEDTNPDGVQRVRTTKNNLYAFLMESTQIEYEVETKCDLKQIGGTLDSKSFGIAMPMNSPYRSAINRAVLKMQESGELGELKTKWWKRKRDEASCEGQADEGDSLKLGLANVGGVFLVLGIGIGLSCTFAVLEFLWNCRNVSVEEHIPYMEALKVELKFACNIFITRKRVKPLLSENNSSENSDKGDEKNDNKNMFQSMLRSIGSNLNINSS